MAGLGRRTHYRKHLTDSVLHDLPEPSSDERIAKVVGTRGLNQFDVLVASSSTSTNEQQREPVLAILPTKFHKLVWVKRNDYVIVQTGMESDEAAYDDDDENEEKATKTNEKSGIRHMITHILYKDQVKHLKSQNLWPIDDSEFQEESRDADEIDDPKQQQQQEIDGIVYYEEEENDDLLFVNTNRLARIEIQDSSSDESSSDEDD